MNVKFLRQLVKCVSVPLRGKGRDQQYLLNRREADGIRFRPLAGKR